ncbi:nitrilase-related carbon-nitrogen hydrolase [Bacteroidota bacterium]
MKDPAQSNSYSYLRNFLLTRQSSLLIMGIVLMLLSDMRGSAGLFAWFMPVPFLIYVTLYPGVKKHLWLLFSLLAGAILTLAKASSDPYFVSLGFSIMSGIIIGFRYYLVFLLWTYIRRWAGEIISIIAFPALIVSFEYIQAFFSPFGDWGSLANTQVYNLPLLQTASLFGFMGISAIISWAAVLIASIIISGSLVKKGIQISIFVVVLTSLYVYGDLRLDNVPKGKNILVAAIMVDNKFTGTMPNPENPDVLLTTDTLINKTRKAALLGASIVVWGEGSTVVSEKGEALFLEKLSELAKTHDIAIVAAYAVLPPKDGQNKDLPFKNKFTWIQENGDIAETYLKHHPVLGEGSQKGVAPLKVVSTKYGKMAGAICYDYDFPQMALTHSRLGAELVVLPGMDWRGMLKRHTLMARIRAIEGGFSLLRSANEATSMGFDNYGQIRAAMSDFGNNDKILIASLPVGNINTLYSKVGNIIAYIAIIVLLFSLFMTVRKFVKRKVISEQ